MPVPGSNLLKMALTVIARQFVIYYMDTGRTANTVGQYVTTYAPPRVVSGSFQPVPRQLYEQFGLDLQKNYFTFYAPNPLMDITRNVSGDQIAFNGVRFQVESKNDWFAMDGWVGVLCVYIGIDTANTQLFGFGSTPPNTYENYGNGNLIGNEP